VQPWLGGFGGSVFDKDGATPTLDTKAMVDTLKFLFDLKTQYAIAPKEADYAAADALFKQGKAAMLINGDWSLAEYRKALGDKLGAAPIPMVSATGKWPAPYISGSCFMIPKPVAGDTLKVDVSFITFYTNYENQIDMVKSLTRLPGLRKALGDELVKNDPIVKGSSEQMALGIPMTSIPEMRCIWGAMKPELMALMAGSKSAADAATAMQAASVVCIKARQ
jgi:arabinogalactan oligomer/maltooligosaccharide transport system substrate-binding protein